jgi:hypothetical protein
MNKQRGVIAMIWLVMAGLIAVGVVLTGLVVAWNSYTTRLDKAGYDRGVAETTAAYQQRDNAQLQAVVAAQKAAEDRAARAERDAATAQSVASANYSKGVKDGQVKTAALVASARAGALRLRDPGRQVGTGPACNPVGQATVAAPAAGGDGGAGAQLSAAASEFLLALAGEADDTARQLGAAQAVIVSDRALCNAP